MDELVTEYHRRMTKVLGCKSQIAELEQEVAVSTAGKALAKQKNLLIAYQSNANRTRAKIKRIALEQYEQDGNETPHPCVLVKSYGEAARSWGYPPIDVLVRIQPLEEEENR